jgi:pseudouridine synthase
MKPATKRTATSGAATGPMRLQRVLARAGVASRRHAESLITAGRVLVNGQPAQLGQSVDLRRDAVTLDGAAVNAPAAVQWFVLHKPAGVLTTRRDPGGRRTVFDLVPDVPGLTYVGRLDYMTEGVLLLTTDGDAAHALTHPSREVERTYVAIVRGPAAQAVRQARGGVELDDGMVKPVAVDARPLGNRRWEFEITIAEGRTREVRRLCEALALEVERLTRVQFGPVKLGGLAPGASRPLTVTEARMIEGLKRMAPRERPVTDEFDDEFDE